MPERRALICTAENVSALIPAPPVENSTAASTAYSSARAVVMVELQAQEPTLLALLSSEVAMSSPLVSQGESDDVIGSTGSAGSGRLDGSGGLLPISNTAQSEMPKRRYTILLADRTSGVIRRVTISARPAVAVACAMAALPVLIGVGAAWKARSDVASLYASHQALDTENMNYRAATEALA